MNILENITFRTDKANVLYITKSEKIRSLTVALGKGAVLKKHSTAVPTTLIVLKGKINFMYADREFLLREFDTYEIPVGEIHEVFGILDQNLFLLIQQM